MAGRVSVSDVTGDTLDLQVHLAAVGDAAAGATVSFSGVVRDHDGGRGVTELEYHGHPTAASVVAEVATEIAARDGVIAVAVSHRIGLLRVGDVALAAAVSAAHRREMRLQVKLLVRHLSDRDPAGHHEPPLAS